MNKNRDCVILYIYSSKLQVIKTVIAKRPALWRSRVAIGKLFRLTA